MKVKELIEELQECDQDKTICIDLQASIYDKFWESHESIYLIWEDDKNCNISLG